MSIATADSYRENFDNLKNRTSAINKRLKAESKEHKKSIQSMRGDNFNNNCDGCITSKTNVEGLDTNFGRIFAIMEDQNKIIGDTHKLMENVIDSLKSKEIYCFRDWINKFFNQVEQRYDAPNDDLRGWKKLIGAFDQKTSLGKVDFRNKDKEYISSLKSTLDKVQMSIDDFEKLYKMKEESNSEFHDQAKTLAEAESRLKMIQFPDQMKEYEESLKKLFEALKIWYSESE
ncbi:unnamed protein product [Rhizophagus irregularis]|nr:unnamed protein product [Rhizophagus irregularis]CAB5167665.1 unnamed protein product [Rhizophagus irregularis]CAB5391565.1 unnamed protein product [Rhizophagus irregularis]